MQSACLCPQALGDILKAEMMNASFLSRHSPVQRPFFCWQTKNYFIIQGFCCSENERH